MPKLVHSGSSVKHENVSSSSSHKGPKRQKLLDEHPRATNGLNGGLKSGISDRDHPMPKSKPDPSQSEKFMFRNELAKPGAEYLEAKTSEKEQPRLPDAHFRLFSTQHRF